MTTHLFFMQYFLLFIDVASNALSDAIKITIAKLAIFAIQDVNQILSIVTLFAMFFHTSIFRAGFFAILFSHFRLTLIVAIAYFTTTIVFQVWSLDTTWNEPYMYMTKSYFSFYVLQKGVAVIYYYLYKHTTKQFIEQCFHEKKAVAAAARPAEEPRIKAPSLIHQIL